MTITSRTLTWLGLVVALFTGVSLAIIVWNTPPNTATMVLFMGFFFLTTAALGTAIMAALQLARGQSAPATALRRGGWVGFLAIILALLQYLELLDAITASAAVLFVLASEILIRHYLRSRQAAPTGSRASRPSDAKTLASQTRKGPKRQRKATGKSSRR